MTPQEEGLLNVELKDTGHHPKVSAAHVFDTLVSANLALVRLLRISIILLIAFGFGVTFLAASSWTIMRSEQRDTRELILAVSKKCTP